MFFTNLVIRLLERSCAPLIAPDNGMIQCSGTSVDDICVFTCDDGFELSGSSSRTCQDDGTWSGTEAVCDVEGQYNYVVYYFIACMPP